MAYTRNVPQATQRISASQPQIQANFQDIDDTIQVDHIQFGNANKGKHKRLTMPVQGGDQPTANNELAFYTKNGILGTPELFLKRHNDGTVYSYTERDNNGTNFGWTRLPSGILLKWGKINRSGSNTSVTMPTSINGRNVPQFNSIYTIQITPQQSSTSALCIANFTIQGNNQFTILSGFTGSQTQPTTFYYFVLGRG